jgi:hypothetical protein
MRMLIAASSKGTVVPGCDGGARPARRWPSLMIGLQAAPDKHGDGLGEPSPFPCGQGCYLAGTRCGRAIWRNGNDAAASETTASNE